MNTGHRISSSDRKRGDNRFMIRQILNIVFMVLALVGVGFYLFGDRTVGIVIVLIAMVFKMAECVIRMIR